MSLLNSVYSKSPVAIQNLMVSAYGARWKRRRFGGIFEAELAGFRERERFDDGQWAAYTRVQLRKLLQHAWNTVPYYRQSFKNTGVDGAKLKQFEIASLEELPMLSKASLRREGKAALLSSTRERRGEYFASSGSTGTPTHILFSFPMHQRWSAAFEARIRHWAGVNRFTPRGMIGGRRVVPEGSGSAPYYRYNRSERQTYFSAYHIAPGTIENYVEGMRRHQVGYMTGYAMSNYFLARFIEESGLSAPAMKAVITSSEKLTEEMRSTFQRVYGCRSFDSWSGVESCAMVSECDHGSLHISPDVGIIEILDLGGNPVKPGEVGEVVCTGFLNYDQPLIRYRIGDEMRLGKKQCSCGRNLPVVEEILGRIEDTVVGKDGREMVRFHGIFTGLSTVLEAQVIQETTEEFVIQVVSTGGISKTDRQEMTKRMQSQLGDVKIEFREVESIPPGPNGKFKAVISKVKRLS